MDKTILIVDDHEGFRKGLKFYLEKQNREIVFYEAASGEDAIEIAMKVNPKVVIMDFKLTGMNGIHAAEKIKQSLPETKIILISLFETRESIKQFKQAPIDAFVAKNSFQEELMPVLAMYL